MRLCRRKLLLLALLSSFALLSGACQGVTNPGGPRAERVANLWWVMLGIGSAVFLIVIVLLVTGLLRSTKRSEATTIGDGTQRLFVLGGGIALPVVVFVVIMVMSVTTGQAVGQSARNGLTVEIQANQWWWAVRYPEADVETANEIHIPSGQPVNVRLTSKDVIHSFWVPQLGGKTDLIPGRTTEMVLEAADPGVYEGRCAEFCGLQHARMLFRVIAQPPDEFQAWLDGQAQPAAQPETDTLLAGQQVFLGSACVYCHTVEGTGASGTLGPDLTHVASRETLAAGTISNNKGNLAGWILDPQSVKPGTQMPPTQLKPSELDVLLTYLMSLK